jgi:hypothetical protein
MLLCAIVMAQPFAGAVDGQTHDVQSSPDGSPETSPFQYGQAGAGFLENLGQRADEAVLFYTTGPVGLDVLRDSLRVRIGGPDGPCTYSLRFDGPRPAGFGGPEGVGPMSYPTNFLMGTSHEGWVRGARTFASVVLRSVYDGIDLELRDTGAGPKYTFVVAPGADPADIRVLVEGALSVSARGGELAVLTRAGEVRDTGLRALQDGPAGRREVPCAFQKRGPMAYGFELRGGWDPSLPLVIDPLIHSTYLGGNDVDWLHAIDLASDGTVYVAGYTSSVDFPTTEGALQQGGAGGFDVYVARLSSNGSRLEWATLLGGSKEDMPWDLQVGADGRVYLTGHTESPNFPTTWGAYMTTISGTRDAFVARLSPDGSSLDWSTFVGGEGTEQATAILPMADGSAYVAGHTTSSYFPTTAGAYDKVMDGDTDVFLLHLASNGMDLIASTLLGGTGSEAEPSLAMDAAGHVCVAGSTTSTDFPTTPGARDRTHNGAKDAFLTLFKADLKGIDASTLLGGLGSDVPRSLQLVQGGGLLLSGYTTSPDLPTTTPDFGRYYQGRTDGWAAMVDGSLSRLDFCCYLGGSDFDAARSADLDPSGTLHVAGYTNSTDMPTTPDAIKGTKASDDHDFFYMEVDRVAGALNYSTYIGGSAGDYAMEMELDGWGVPTIGGYSHSSDFPTTEGAYGRTFMGGGDAVVLRFSRDADPPWFLGDLTGAPTMMEPLTFETMVWDATGVSSVKVEYWIDYGDHVEDYYEAMSATTEGTYRYNIIEILPPEAWLLDYRFLATDVLGHANATEMVHVVILDNMPPTVWEDRTPSVGGTGDNLTISVRADDNRHIVSARFEYRFGSAPSVTKMQVPPYAPIWWELTIVLPSDSLLPLSYRVTFLDAANNSAVTQWKTVQVRDDDPPVLGLPVLPTFVGPGTNFTVTVAASDNMGITSAVLTYTFDGNNYVDVPAPEPFAPVLSFDIIVPPDEMHDVYIEVSVEDAAGNVANASSNISNKDVLPPNIYPQDICATATTGDPFTVHFTATDPSGIARLAVRWWFGSGQPQLYQLPAGSELTWTIDVPSDSLDVLHYELEAEDGRGQVARLGPFAVPVLDDAPPIAEAGTNGQIRTGGVVHLDGTQSTDNIRIVRWVWLYEDEGHLQQAEGSKMDVTLRTSGTHVIRLNVYDAANNTASDTVTIEVKEVAGGGGIGWWLLVAAVVVAVAIVALVAFLLIRRSRGPRKGS